MTNSSSETAAYNWREEFAPNYTNGRPVIWVMPIIGGWASCHNERTSSILCHNSDGHCVYGDSTFHLKRIPKPPRPWSAPEDVPEDIERIRLKDKNATQRMGRLHSQHRLGYIPLRVDSEGIRVIDWWDCKPSVTLMRFDAALQNAEYRTIGSKEWKPCVCEVQP